MRALQLLLLTVVLSSTVWGQEAWKPASGPLTTPWTDKVSPDNVHSEYPRPQMVRPRWNHLNGLWDYAIRPRNEERPNKWDGQILVPFPVESALSGVMKKVGADHRLWYRRTFEAPQREKGERLLLHFGAVDWQCEVWVNGRSVGKHQGGYDPFTFDITDAIANQGEQEIVVAVWDPTDQGYQPRGKQVRNPEGIWYTSVTGIWQTVWLEPVPATHISSYVVTPDIDRNIATVVVHHTRADANARPVVARVRVELPRDDNAAQPQFLEASGAPGEPIALTFSDPGHVRLWSPDSPHLYPCEITLHPQQDAASQGKAPALDKVQGYFAMRKISLGKGEDGFVRMMLNNQPVFQFGTLDQGWWPDGLYTAPTDEALRFDIEMTKKLGFNTIRKHVKVEPARWYYHCDRLGMLVWQDMPNGDRHIGPNDPDLVRSPESAANYRQELQQIIDDFRNAPCIVVWVPFNEGWGQFDTADILAWVKNHDPTRLVDGPSGWTDRGVGDMHDMHRYPGPAMPNPEPNRAVVLGEFGGLGLPLEGHLWWDKRNWGYRTYKTREELWTNYRRLIRNLHPLVAKGLSAAIYTQTTDVEGEVNGLMTYDRRAVKFDIDAMAALHARLYQPAPTVEVRTLAPTSEQEGQTWRYTTTAPGKDWTAVDFDDSSWKEGPGGFGEPSTPGAIVRTRWKSNEIWLRRTFEIPAGAVHNPHLRIHHDEDVEVYLDGRRIAKLDGYVVEYFNEELDAPARELLTPGVHVIAVHCRQTQGGQYIDVGLVDLVEKPQKP